MRFLCMPQRQLTNDQETYLKIYDLVSHAEHRNVESFFHLNLMARFLLQCLRVAGYFDPPARAGKDCDCFSSANESAR